MTDRTHTFPHPLLRLEATADEQTIVAALPSGREKTLVTAETNPLTGGSDITTPLSVLKLPVGVTDLTAGLGGSGGASVVVLAKSLIGVDSTGATDCTAALNAALAAIAPGTTVYFEPGIYVASVRLTVPKTTITGTWAATIQTPSDATSHINDACVRILADDCVVEKLTLNGNKAGNPAIDDFNLGRWSDGVAIYANRATVRHNRIKDSIGHKVIVWNESFDPTSTPKGARSFFTIEGNHITGVGQRASIDVASTDVTAAVSNNGIIKGNIIDDMVLIVHTGYDLLIEGNILRNTGLLGGGIDVHTNSKRVIVANNIIGPCTVGITTHNFCEDIAIVGNKISSTSGVGVMVADCTRATVDSNQIYSTGAGAPAISLQPAYGGAVRNNTISNSGNHSVNISGSSTNVLVSGNKSYSPTSYHVNINGAADVIVRGNSCSGGVIGVAATTGTNTGLIIEGNDIKGTSSTGVYVTAADSLIRNNSIRNAGAYAIRSHGQNSRISGNDIRDTTGSGIYIPVVTGVAITDNYITNSSVSSIAGIQPDTVVRRNVGYVTESRGSTTVADATASIVVNHGLATTPTSVTLTPRGNEFAWVSARTSTTFTITRAGTSGVLAVDWQSEI